MEQHRYGMLLKTLVVIAIALFAHIKDVEGQRKQKSNYNMTTTKEKGKQAPKENFTGTVWVNMVAAASDNLNTVIGQVTFETKARTNWHRHSTGQILIVVAGVGYYQEKGKPIEIIREGDVVKIGKGVEHWHGASYNSSMTHTAIVPDAENDKTEWLKPVTDDEYNKYEGSLETSSRANITETAHKNHEELWPNYQSKLKATDPELIEVFDNFAFDDVVSHDTMNTKTRVMMITASTIGSQALSEYKMMVNGALNVGVTPVEVKEILYQAVPYVGIAKVLDFINATNEIFTERGISLPLEGQSTTDRRNRKEKGLEVQKQIVGNMVDNMYKNSPKDLLHIQEYLSANFFGDFVARGGLDLKTREMVTLSFLIALGGTESQIKGHITGNVNVGNDRQILINLMTQLLPYVGYPRTLNAINCLNEVLPAK
jgi:4-carboxymuconolactone decarboxylase